jgi:hypothetical protein
MGADLLLQIIPYPELTPERIELLNTIISNITYDDFDDLYYIEEDNFNDHINDHDPHTDYIETNNDVETSMLNNEKENLKYLISRLDTIASKRDTTYFLIDNIRYIITGGMSWGDDPSDSYNDIFHIANCTRLYDTLHTLAVEDIVIRNKRRDL